MNNLQFINKNFNASNISKYQYTISLIKECVRFEILPQNYLYTIQIKIGDILKELIIKHTKGESSSVIFSERFSSSVAISRADI